MRLLFSQETASASLSHKAERSIHEALDTVGVVGHRDVPLHNFERLKSSKQPELKARTYVLLPEMSPRPVERDVGERQEEPRRVAIRRRRSGQGGFRRRMREITR